MLFPFFRSLCLLSIRAAKFLHFFLHFLFFASSYSSNFFEANRFFGVVHNMTIQKEKKTILILYFDSHIIEYFVWTKCLWYRNKYRENETEKILVVNIIIGLTSLLASHIGSKIYECAKHISNVFVRINNFDLHIYYVICTKQTVFIFFTLFYSFSVLLIFFSHSIFSFSIFFFAFILSSSNFI